MRPTLVVVPGSLVTGEGRVRRRGTPVQPQVRHVAAPVLLGMVLLGAWLLLSSGLPSYVLPTPGSVILKLWTGITSRSLLAPLGSTLVEAAAGCLGGAVVAIPLAMGGRGDPSVPRRHPSDPGHRAGSAARAVGGVRTRADRLAVRTDRVLPHPRSRRVRLASPRPRGRRCRT